MADESVLTDEVRALVGSEAAPLRVRVTPRVVQRVVETYQLRPRTYAEGDAVPGMVVVALQSEAEMITIPDVLPNSLLISNEVDFERPLRMGEELVVVSRLADIRERLGGRFGYSVYVRTENEFRQPDGTVAARSAQTMMYYDPAGASGDEDGE